MMADLHRNSQRETPTPLKRIAERQGISKRYLDQLAASLKRAGLIASVWGVNGGYRLSRPGREITVLEIIKDVEGPVSILACVAEPQSCNRTKSCDCRHVWSDINQALVDKMASYTLKDIVNKD